MSELRLEEYVMPAGNLGPASPLTNLWYDTSFLVAKKVPGPGLTEDDVKYFGYGYHNGCLPYFSQDDYDRSRSPRGFKVAVLENENIRLGPSLPAFISPAVLDVLVQSFRLAPVTTPEADLKAILG